MPKSVIPLIGAGFARRTTDADFVVGTATVGDDNKTYVYVKATEAVSGTCSVDSSFNVTDAAGSYTVAASTNFASGEYGWVYKTTSPL